MTGVNGSAAPGGVDPAAEGPLAGTRVVEMRAIGPAPFAGMVLSDLGASVTQIDRAGGPGIGPAPHYDVMNRGRRSVAINLKREGAAEVALRLIEQADVLIEGYRPGVMERLGLAPQVCLERNPRLIYGRMTGWGQTGAWAHRAGHDINYIGMTGALHAIGRPDSPPPPPLSLVGDFGGGGMLLLVGILAALAHRSRTGCGQVVDAAIVDGTTLMSAVTYGLLAEGSWSSQRGANVVDSGAPYYDCYQTADGGYVAVGAIEPQFWRTLLTVLDMPSDWVGAQNDRSRWPEFKRALQQAFSTRTRDDLVAEVGELDACLSPVLSMREALEHPILRERRNFVPVDGIAHPAPAPRFSATPGAIQGPPPTPGEHWAAVLADAGFSESEIAAMVADGRVTVSERQFAR